MLASHQLLHRHTKSEQDLARASSPVLIGVRESPIMALRRRHPQISAQAAMRHPQPPSRLSPSDGPRVKVWQKLAKPFHEVFLGIEPRPPFLAHRMTEAAVSILTLTTNLPWRSDGEL